MKSKLIYVYDQLTLLHIENIEVYESPEEPGKYHYPDHSNWTLKPLPALAKNEAAKFNKTRDDWDVVPDFRGKTAWDTTSGAPIVIEQAGALSAGLSLTEPQIAIDNRNADAKTGQIAAIRAMRETVLGRLDGIAGRAVRAGDTSGVAAACDAAIVSLLSITDDAGVISATDGNTAKAALAARWKKIETDLTIRSAEAAKAFSGVSFK
jgi:hypothetical protein